MPDEETQLKKKKKVPTWVWIVAGVFVLVVAVASGGGGDSSNDASDEGVAVVEEGDSTTQDAAEPEEVMEAEPEAEEPAAREETGYSDGTYFVGDEIEAAIYRSTGGGSCYWERLSGFGGSFDEIIANGSGPQSIAGISSTDIGFSSSGCGSWVPVESTFPDAALTSFGDGDYVVGSHIEPGTYRAEILDGCYWDRLSGFGGSFSEIIANGLEQPIVEISSSDAGFVSDGCGTWSRQG